jgi:hypothetical protein
LGITWREEAGERLVDLRQKRGVFDQKSLKNGQKVGKNRPFLGSSALLMNHGRHFPVGAIGGKSRTALAISG